MLIFKESDRSIGYLIYLIDNIPTDKSSPTIFNYAIFCGFDTYFDTTFLYYITLNMLSDLL